MDEQVYRFRHRDVMGAVIRILDDETLSVNEFLDEQHQLGEGDECAFAYTCCYLAYRGRHILVDAGFDPDTTAGALESLDVLPEDIALVLLTHADRDHVAGLLMPDGSLAYPNALHTIGREHWQHLGTPEMLASLDGERAAFYRKLLRALEDHVMLCDDGCEVEDGIRFLLSSGHRIGHGVYELETDGTPLIHSGDSFLHPLFAEHPDWVNLTDSKPDEAVESRKALVARAAASQALVLGSHIPFPGIGQLDEIGDMLYQWTAVAAEE